METRAPSAASIRPQAKPMPCELPAPVASVEVRDRLDLALAGRLGRQPPGGSGGDEQQLPLAWQLDRRRQRRPRRIERVRHAQVEDVDNLVRPAGGQRTASEALAEGKRAAEVVVLMGGVQSGPGHKLLQLVALLVADHLL